MHYCNQGVVEWLAALCSAVGAIWRHSGSNYFGPARHELWLFYQPPHTLSWQEWLNRLHPTSQSFSLSSIRAHSPPAS